MPLGGFCSLLKVDLDAYFTTNVLETFNDTHGKRYHHVDVAVVVLVVDVVTAPRTVVSLCVAVCMVVLGFKYIESLWELLLPD